MTHFPVTNSILSAKHLEQFIQETYLLSGDTKCELIRSGINDTYLITDNVNKFVFRVYSLSWRTKTEIEEEIKLLNHLKQNSISISYPLTNKENQYIQTLNAPEGERFAVLFTYANGQKLHSYSVETHFLIGELMAKLHKVTINQTLIRVNYTPKILLIDSLNKIERFLSSGSEEMAFMKSTQQYLLNEFSKIDNKEVRTGIVHFDIWFDNLNITNENTVTIFDFDFCGNGLLCLDIAYYILQVNSIEREETECKLKVESFLKGYNSITKIANEEMRIIPMLGVSLYFFYLGVQCQRFDNWSNSFLSENYLKRFINGLVKRYFDLNKLGRT